MVYLFLQIVKKCEHMLNMTIFFFLIFHIIGEEASAEGCDKGCPELPQDDGQNCDRPWGERGGGLGGERAEGHRHCQTVQRLERISEVCMYFSMLLIYINA